MQINPYLFYNGNCQEALKYYEKVLGAQIGAMFPYGDGPPDMPVPPDWKNKLMHGPANFMSRLIQVFMNLDTMIGKDFEAGLANLKTLTEK